MHWGHTVEEVDGTSVSVLRAYSPSPRPQTLSPEKLTSAARFSARDAMCSAFALKWLARLQAGRDP